MRRKFIDGVISQSDKIYLENLIQYNKILGQRNALLKYFSNNNTFDNDAIEVYNSQLSNSVQKFTKKDRHLLRPLPLFF